MEGGWTLLQAAQAAPDEKKRAKFVALVKELKCGDETVEDLLAEGKLWSNWKERVRGTANDDVLAGFFDYCKRETQASSPIGPPVKAIGAVLDELMEGHKNRRRVSLDKEKSKTSEVPRVDASERARLGDFLKFVNREKSINTLLVHASGQYRRYLTGFQQKEAQFAACSGGPGLGKTMFCRKAFLRAVDEKGVKDEAIIWTDVKQDFGEGKNFKGIVKECVDYGRLFHIFRLRQSYYDLPCDGFKYLQACEGRFIWCCAGKAGFCVFYHLASQYFILI